MAAVVAATTSVLADENTRLANTTVARIVEARGELDDPVPQGVGPGMQFAVPLPPPPQPQVVYNIRVGGGRHKHKHRHRHRPF